MAKNSDRLSKGAVDELTAQIRAAAENDPELRTLAIGELERLSSSLDSDPESIDSMPVDDVVKELQELGLDPNKPLLRGDDRIIDCDKEKTLIPFRHRKAGNEVRSTTQKKETGIPKTPRRGGRVLIADDEPEIRDVLWDLLSPAYECTAVGSAEEALARLRETTYDLVISDIMMGGMSGLEMIPHVQAASPDTVVIMISGVQTVESAIHALRAGAFDYVMKPFDIQHVEAAVSRGLEHNSLLVSKRLYENHLEQMVEQRTAELDGALRSLEDAYRTTLKALTAALETRDQETHGHSERVVNFSLRLGRELNLDEEQMRSLEFGSLLHDIGKIGVPDAILRKPAALSEAEWVRMREHPLHGQKILRGIRFLEGAARVVAQHHEKWDGSGYPLGLRGEAIDLNARIFAVADAFDAITSDRVYRRGRSYDEAVAELEQFGGRQFDPHVVEAFTRVPREEWDEIRQQSLEARERMTTTRHLGSTKETDLNPLVPMYYLRVQ